MQNVRISYRSPQAKVVSSSININEEKVPVSSVFYKRKKKSEKMKKFLREE